MGQGDTTPMTALDQAWVYYLTHCTPAEFADAFAVLELLYFLERCHWRSVRRAL